MVIRPGDLKGAQHDLTLRVRKDDIIRFLLERGSDPENDLLVWMPVIRYAGQASTGGDVVRILCGAARPYVDDDGHRWNADRDYQGGRPISTAKVTKHAAVCADARLFRHGRAGSDFTYCISVMPGIYDVRMLFADPEYDQHCERPINLDINGRRVLTDFDIVRVAHGGKRGIDRMFAYVVPDAEGHISLRFTGGTRYDGKRAQAIVQAIEVLPAFRSLIRVNCGSAKPFVDWNGDVWDADPVSGGKILRSDLPVMQAAPTLFDQPFYQVARAGRTLLYHFRLAPGAYTVHLKFAELWLPKDERRSMRVEINGRIMMNDFDPAEAAGQKNMAFDARWERITPDSGGYIVVRLVGRGKHNAILQGIEVE